MTKDVPDMGARTLCHLHMLSSPPVRIKLRGRRLKIVQTFRNFNYADRQISLSEYMTSAQSDRLIYVCALKESQVALLRKLILWLVWVITNLLSNAQPVLRNDANMSAQSDPRKAVRHSQSVSIIWGLSC